MTYRKFDTGTWEDKNFESLEPMERYLFIYLWTNNLCNQSGIYEITLRRIEFDTKIPSTTLEPTLEGISRMVSYSREKQVVYVKNFLRRQCQNKQFAESAIEIVKEKHPEYLQEFVKINKILFDRYGITVDDVACDGYQPDTNPPSTPTEQNRTEAEQKQAPPKKKFIPPTEPEVIAYFCENGYSAEAAKKAFKYYTAGGWKDSHGKPVKNWKQKVIAVWFKDENKAKPESNRELLGVNGCKI